MPASRDFNLTLLNRTLSVQVKPGEEATLQRAATVVQDKVAAYKASYGVSDDVYLLLMCCLDLALDAQQALAQQGKDFGELGEQLKATLALADSALANLGHRS